jgi:hypothetical protein
MNKKLKFGSGNYRKLACDLETGLLDTKSNLNTGENVSNNIAVFHTSPVHNQEFHKNKPFLILDTGDGQVFDSSCHSNSSFQPSSVYNLNCDYYLKCAELNVKCKTPCQLIKFFDRYGIERYLNLGIGSKL